MTKDDESFVDMGQLLKELEEEEKCRTDHKRQTIKECSCKLANSYLYRETTGVN